MCKTVQLCSLEIIVNILGFSRQVDIYRLARGYLLNPSSFKSRDNSVSSSSMVGNFVSSGSGKARTS